MRKSWPLAAALTLGIAAPVPAQFSLSGAQITNGPNTNASGSMVPTVGMAQMLPKVNMGSAVGNPFGGTRTFNFSRMIPTFPGLRGSLFPVRTPPAQLPQYTTGKKK